MITPSRIARVLGLVGLAAFLGLAARTSTATQAFDDGVPPPPPAIGGAALIKDPKPLLVSRVDGFPFTQDEPDPSTITPVPAPDVLIPPHEPAAEGHDELVPIPAPPAPDSEPKPKPAKETVPPIALDPADSADAAPPIVPDLTGDDFPSIDPTPEPLSIDPATAPLAPIDTPIPAPAERPKAWRADREGASRSAPTSAIVVEIDEAPAVSSNDPGAQARSFVERNQREAEERLKALQAEADELRDRLSKLDDAIQQWQSLADAMRTARDAAAVQTEAPQPKPADRETPAQAEAATTLEPLPAPRQAGLGSQPQSARAQDVPAPPLR